MKKYSFLLLLILGLATGCKEQAVHLPLIDIPGISEIQNHSSIWVFKEVENNVPTARLNKNNKILNTHWIFNIDKDLPMTEVVPVLIKMQENRNKDSMHKKEGMINYFSYADTASKQISLIPFSDKNYLVQDRETIFSKLSTVDSCTLTIEIINNSVKINGKIILLDELATVIKKMDECQEETGPAISLVYDDRVSYQDYLHTKVYLYDHGIDCDSVEYMYTVK